VLIYMLFIHWRLHRIPIESTEDSLTARPLTNLYDYRDPLGKLYIWLIFGYCASVASPAAQVPRTGVAPREFTCARS
jgi:hypothetical protein